MQKLYDQAINKAIMREREEEMLEIHQNVTKVNEVRLYYCTFNVIYTKIDNFHLSFHPFSQELLFF